MKCCGGNLGARDTYPDLTEFEADASSHTSRLNDRCKKIALAAANIDQQGDIAALRPDMVQQQLMTHLLSRAFAHRLRVCGPMAGPIIAIGHGRFERLHGHSISFLADAAVPMALIRIATWF